VHYCSGLKTTLQEEVTTHGTPLSVCVQRGKSENQHAAKKWKMSDSHYNKGYQYILWEICATCNWQKFSELWTGIKDKSEFRNVIE
jgi:hypothetical protein